MVPHIRLNLRNLFRTSLLALEDTVLHNVSDNLYFLACLSLKSTPVSYTHLSIRAVEILWKQNETLPAKATKHFIYYKYFRCIKSILKTCAFSMFFCGIYVLTSITTKQITTRKKSWMIYTHIQQQHSMVAKRFRDC